MQEVAHFNENDEMVITKLDISQTADLPAGYVKINRGEPVGHYKVSKDMQGEAFITNLENINKKRVEQQSTEKPAEAPQQRQMIDTTGGNK